MKTVYANTAHPGLVKWSIGIAIALGIFLYILYISLDDKYKLLLYIAAFSFLYGAGTGFMDIRTSKEKADKIVAQLLNANPTIEVKHANYL